MTITAPMATSLELPPGRPRGSIVTEVIALAMRRLLHTARSPGRLVGVIMNPLVLLVAVGYLFEHALRAPVNGHYIDFLVPGVGLQVGLASIGPTAISVRLDLREGIIDRFRSLPISPRAALIAHSLCDFLVALVALAMTLGAGLILGWRPHSGLPSVLAGAAVLAGFAYAMVWVGILLGMTVSAPESIDSIGALLLVVATFVSSAIVSPQGYPAWLRPVVRWNPISTAADACRRLWQAPVAGGGQYASTHPIVIAVPAILLILSVASELALRRFRLGLA